MPRCWIGLGGNQGDVAATFERAIDSLCAAPGLAYVTTSPRYRTAPMGAAAGEAFLNAVVGFDVSRPPLELLDLLQSVEHDNGRVRTVSWGPRTLDLDLLYYGDLILEDPRLTLPHPGVWYRRFVLDPFVAVASLWCDPLWNLTVSALRERLRAQPPSITLFGATDAMLDELHTALAVLHPTVLVQDNHVAAAMHGGLAVQIGSVVTPRIPRFHLPADIPARSLSGLLAAAATAAFTEPVPV